MSAIILTVIILGLLPICFLRPWVGILVWSWIGYMNPHRLTWGFSYSMPYAQIVAIVTLGGLFFTKETSPLPLMREVYLLIALWGIFFLSTVFAIYPDIAWDKFIKVSKILFITFLTLMLFQDYKKLRFLILVITLSLGFYGLKGGIWGVLNGGEYMLNGPPDSFIQGNTNLGLALVMVLPVIFFIRRDEPRRWLRYLLQAMFYFSIIAILVTYSRGAFVGLTVVLFLLILRSNHRALAVILLATGIILSSVTLPEKWFGRIQTIETYEEDRSAMSRLRVWKMSYRLALDRPILGGGFDPYSEETYYYYLPDEDLSGDSSIGTGAHSNYLQILGEHGFIGLTVYVMLLLSMIFSLRRISRRSRNNPSMRFIYNYTQMLEISIVGFCVSGIFLSMCYFDLFFSLLAITIILKKLVLAQEKEQKTGFAVV